jgi:chaperonin cofactor prefoldin
MQNNIYEININKLLECINSLEKRIETLEIQQKALKENIKGVGKSLSQAFSKIKSDLNCLADEIYS